MKTKWMVGLFLISVLTISVAVAQQDGASQTTDSALASLPNLQSRRTATPGEQLQLPAGVQDGQQYPERLDIVLRSMTQELGEIAQAARDGKISRTQAEYLSLERYYVALTRYQFLRTLYQSPEETTPEASTPQADSTLRVSGGTVIVQPQASSADISPELIAYLELNPVQTAAVRAQIAEDRKQVQPLLDRLEKSRGELISLKLSGFSDAKKVRALAAEQSRLIKQLIVANTELETKIYKMLTDEQRKRADGLWRQGLVSAKVAFPDW